MSPATFLDLLARVQEFQNQTQEQVQVRYAARAMDLNSGVRPGVPGCTADYDSPWENQVPKVG